MHPEDANYDPLFPLGAGLTTIEFDSASSASDGAGQTTTLSWSHTIGNGQDRVLAVGVSAADTSATDLVVTGVTYNGVAMTTISDTNSIAGDTNLIATELYYMPESNLPATGTYTAQVTYAGSVEDITAGAVSLANVMQQPAEVVAISADPNASTISTSVATLSEGTWLIDVLGTADPCVMTKGVVQTTRWSQSSDISSAACSTRVIPAPRPVSMDWRGPNETILVQSVAAFKPIQIIYPDETDLNGDFVLDLIDIGIFMNQWNPGSLPDPAPDNLVSMWKFDEASGTYAADSIGVNHGTTNAGWTDGKASSAIDFDGTEIVNCGNDISLDITRTHPKTLRRRITIQPS